MGKTGNKATGTQCRVLVVAPSWVGDLVMAHSLVRLLKRHYPEASIDILALKWCQACIDRMPEVNESIEMPVGHGKLQLGARYRLGKQLRAKQYDRAYVLPNSWKSALIPFFAKIPVRIGWQGEFRKGLLTDCRKLDKQALPLMVQRFAALGLNPGAVPALEAIPFPKFVSSSTQKQAVLDKFDLTTEQPVLAFAPGAAFGEAKRWPVAHFAQVAQTAAEKGWQVWQLGSPDDEEIMQEIDRISGGNTIILGGRATLADKVDLLNHVSALVSNDSGLMHVGCALGKPVVGVFGSTSPDFTPPLGEQVAILAREDLSCRPCFKRQCPLLGDAHLQCLVGITPRQVMAALGQWFGVWA